jgi:MFS family permease
MVLMVFTGFGMMVQLASGNTILQTVTDDSKRARVMSFHGMAFMGMVPIGSLIAGTVADRLASRIPLFCAVCPL